MRNVSILRPTRLLMSLLVAGVAQTGSLPGLAAQRAAAAASGSEAGARHHDVWPLPCCAPPVESGLCFVTGSPHEEELTEEELEERKERLERIIERISQLIEKLRQSEPESEEAVELEIERASRMTELQEVEARIRMLQESEEKKKRDEREREEDEERGEKRDCPYVVMPLGPEGTMALFELWGGSANRAMLRTLLSDAGEIRRGLGRSRATGRLDYDSFNAVRSAALRMRETLAVLVRQELRSARTDPARAEAIPLLERWVSDLEVLMPMLAAAGR